MVKVIIKIPRRYAIWLAAHLQKEHRKTKGRISIRR
jgi:hypothetical protein